MPNLHALAAYPSVSLAREMPLATYGVNFSSRTLWSSGTENYFLPEPFLVFETTGDLSGRLAAEDLGRGLEG